jgi:hypothetical protein
MRDCFDADVHARMARVGKLDRDCLGNDLVAFYWLIAINDLMIRRQQQFDAFSFGSLHDFQRRLQHIVFNQRLAHSKALRLEERVGHRSANQNLVNLTIDQRIDHRNLV